MFVSSPFYSVLKKSLHFREWRDNSDVQSFNLVFAIWIPPESGEKKGEKYILTVSHNLIPVQIGPAWTLPTFALSHCAQICYIFSQVSYFSLIQIIPVWFFFSLLCLRLLPVTVWGLRGRDGAAPCSLCRRWSRHRSPPSHTDPGRPRRSSAQTSLSHPAMCLRNKGAHTERIFNVESHSVVLVSYATLFC